MLEIRVRPGWKKGTTVTFPKEGDEGPGLIPPDISFVIGEKPHPRFQREGNNLVYKAQISLAEALTDCTVRVVSSSLFQRHPASPHSHLIDAAYLRR